MAVLEQLIGQVLDEKYRIDKQLGQGGMGTVYLATHLGTGRPVAVKIISPQFMTNEMFVERFKREAKAAGLLRHPNVVNVTDFGFAPAGSQRLAYLVMEYLDGCSLAEVLKEEKRPPLGFVVDIIEQTCLAISEAHRQGIIHRDLKPDNIWLEPNERGGYTVKVLDFGLAKLRDVAQPMLVGESAAAGISSVKMLPYTETEPVAISSQVSSLEMDIRDAPTQVMPNRGAGELKAETEINTPALEQGITGAGTVIGTPLYMSPEQCRSEELDARSDIYSLGVIAYQMLAGETPFTGDVYSLIAQHINAPPLPLKKRRPDIPKPVAELVMSALAKSPSERPATAATFASALRARAEGLGALLRKTLTICGEHFSTIVRVSLIGYAPIIAITVLHLLSGMALKDTEPSTNIRPILLPGILTYLLITLSGIVIIGVLVPVLVQVLIAPLRPVQIRPAFAALRKRLRPFVNTFLWYYIVLTSVIGLFGPVPILKGPFYALNEASKDHYFRDLLGFTVLLFFATIVFLFAYVLVKTLMAVVNYSLSLHAVIMEGLQRKVALDRSKALVVQSRSTVIGLLALTATVFIIPMVVEGQFSRESNTSLVLFSIFNILLNFLGVTFFATAYALLYFKMRQASGETLKEVLSQYEKEIPAPGNWQSRMRERINTHIQ